MYTTYKKIGACIMLCLSMHHAMCASTDEENALPYEPKKVAIVKILKVAGLFIYLGSATYYVYHTTQDNSSH